MKKTFYIVMVFALTVQMAFASQNRKVLVIGIDGCRSDALQQANTPVLDGLIASGLFTYDAWHCGITVSGPSWSTIMTGTWWNKHGVTSNAYTGSNFNSYPYFPTRAKELKPNLQCVQVVEWAPMSDNVYNDGWNKKLKTPDGDGASTAAVAATEIVDPNLDCMFVYFDAVDLTGHSSGFSPTNPSYIQAIENVDSRIGVVLNALYSRTNYATEDWLILITTDHGGTGTGHGGNSLQERQIWWIANGASVTHQQITAADPGTYNPLIIGIFNQSGVDTALLKQSPVQSDIAVTALHHLIYDTGVKPEEQAAWKLDGKSWLSTFSGTGINDMSGENAVTIFPNPTTGMVSLWFENKNRNTVNVGVYDLLGRNVRTFENLTATNKVNIDLSGLSCGTYVTKIQIGTQTLTRKIHLQN